MAFYKNKAGQVIVVTAYQGTDRYSGDAANITGRFFYGTVTVGTLYSGTNPTEYGTSGVYFFSPSQAETNTDCITFVPETTTSGVILEHFIAYTQPETRNTGTAQAVLSSPNPTGGTVGLAIQVNSGTVDRANSVPAPTSGTIGLVQAVTNLTFSGTSVNANIQKVVGSSTNDGVGWDVYFKKDLGRLLGTMVRGTNQYTVLDQSGGTLMIINAGTDSRTVA